MEKIVLKFRSAVELWTFKMIIKLRYVKIDFRNCTMVCECTEEQAQIAIQVFRAEVVKRTSLIP